MKVLKITLLFLAVLFLTVSGQSSDVISNNDKPQIETYKQIKIAHIKRNIKVPGQG